MASTRCGWDRCGQARTRTQAWSLWGTRPAEAPRWSKSTALRTRLRSSSLPCSLIARRMFQNMCSTADRVRESINSFQATIDWSGRGKSAPAALCRIPFEQVATLHEGLSCWTEVGEEVAGCISRCPSSSCRRAGSGEQPVSANNPIRGNHRFAMVDHSYKRSNTCWSGRRALGLPGSERLTPPIQYCAISRHQHHTLHVHRNRVLDILPYFPVHRYGVGRRGEKARRTVIASPCRKDLFWCEDERSDCRASSEEESVYLPIGARVSGVFDAHLCQLGNHEALRVSHAE